MFNFFKRNKEPEYDPLNVKVTDLKKGFIFEYDLRQWEVQAEYTYDWGDNYFSKEYKVSDGTDTFFLSVEQDDEVEVALHEKVRLSAFEQDIEADIIDNGRPPKTIIYQGTTFRREDESPGYFREEDGGGDWTEMIGWDYYDADEEQVLTIEQWGEREFDASVGKFLESHEISNIIPGE